MTRSRAVAWLPWLADRERAVAVGERLMLALIVVNTVALVVSTMDSLSARYVAFLNGVEYVAVAAFTVEFVARVTSRVQRRAGDGPRLVDVHLLVDLLAILPFYVGLATGVQGLGSSSMVRVLRLFKLARYVDGVERLARVVRRKRADLAVSVFGTSLLWLVAASAIYFVEHEAQPEAFASIPAAMWWAGVTITTVGYGDVYPVTPLGRLLGVVVSLLGVGIAAVPSSILVTGFLEENDAEQEREPTRCPHCGSRTDE